jgi:hypothetical protein
MLGAREVPAEMHGTGEPCQFDAGQTLCSSAFAYGFLPDDPPNGVAESVSSASLHPPTVRSRALLVARRRR